MWGQNSLQGIPKSTVYCRVATAIQQNGNDVAFKYELRSDQQNGVTYGLSDTRGMHNPLSGYFTPPEPGVYFFVVNMYHTGGGFGAVFYMRDDVSGRDLYSNAFGVDTTGRSITYSGVALLTGFEKIRVSSNNGNLAGAEINGNSITFIKLYDLPDF